MSDTIWASLSKPDKKLAGCLDAKRRKGESMMKFAKRSYNWQNITIMGASKREVKRYEACLFKLYGKDWLAPYSLRISRSL